ncbi:MAG: nitrilase-related carbon-nitrogen hydrolase [Fluviicola sp.]|jgi:omega-amidase
MRDLNVTLVQADQVWENKAANFSNYLNLLSGLEQTDLIVLPEMFNTAFSMNAEELAEEFDLSESIEWLKQLAKVKNAAVYTSLMIQSNGNFYNRGVFVRSSGEIEFYDKRKRFAMAGEDTVFSAGNEEVIVDYLGWKINLQVCYDLRFPENIRNEMKDGKAKYDLLLYVANWPERRVTHWKSLLVARAIENQCYVIGVNRVGTDGKGLTYSGDSFGISPLGEKIGEIQQFEQKSETINLDVQLLTETREKLPFLKDR